MWSFSALVIGKLLLPLLALEPRRKLGSVFVGFGALDHDRVIAPTDKKKRMLEGKAGFSLT